MCLARDFLISTCLAALSLLVPPGVMNLSQPSSSTSRCSPASRPPLRWARCRVPLSRASWPGRKRPPAVAAPQPHRHWGLPLAAGGLALVLPLVLVLVLVPLALGR